MIFNFYLNTFIYKIYFFIYEALISENIKNEINKKITK